jgi:hypothetical protein
MGIIFFGRKRTAIDIGEAFLKCPACESHKWADIMVFSLYFHIYWVPIFPYDKEVNIICKDCELKRFEMPFNEQSIGNLNEVKYKYKHPWRTYTGISIFLLLVLGIIISQMVS